MGCAARNSQKPALELGGWAGGAHVPCFCLHVCGDNGEVDERYNPVALKWEERRCPRGTNCNRIARELVKV